MSVGFDGMGAAYFDGDRPVAEDVSLHIANDNLQIGLDSEDIIFWRLGDIRLVPDQARGKDYTLRSVTDPLARLIVADKTLLRHLPAARRPAPARGRRRLFAWAMAAVAAVALQITVLVPFLADRLANFIPPCCKLIWQAFLLLLLLLLILFWLLFVFCPDPAFVSLSRSPLPLITRPFLAHHSAPTVPPAQTQIIYLPHSLSHSPPLQMQISFATNSQTFLFSEVETARVSL